MAPKRVRALAAAALAHRPAARQLRPPVYMSAPPAPKWATEQAAWGACVAWGAVPELSVVSVGVALRAAIGVLAAVRELLL